MKPTVENILREMGNGDSHCRCEVCTRKAERILKLFDEKPEVEWEKRVNDMWTDCREPGYVSKANIKDFIRALLKDVFEVSRLNQFYSSESLNELKRKYGIE